MSTSTRRYDSGTAVLLVLLALQLHSSTLNGHVCVYAKEFAKVFGQLVPFRLEPSISFKFATFAMCLVANRVCVFQCMCVARLN